MPGSLPPMGEAGWGPPQFSVLSLTPAPLYVCFEVDPITQMNKIFPMKKLHLLIAAILLLAISFVAPTQANAQDVKTIIPTPADDTLTNADTATVYISNATSGVGSVSTAVAESSARSVECLLTKLSGTAAGSVKLQGSVDGTNYITISTDTFTNITSNVFVYSMRSSTGDLIYKQYRVQFITSGTVSAIPKVYYLRRN